MATDSHGRVDVDVQARASGVVARITIDNATKLNVIGSALMAEFVDEMTVLGAREDLRAVVLTGAGDRAFIGGANIHEMAGLDAARAREFITGLHRMCAAIPTCRCRSLCASTATRSGRGSKSRPPAT